MGDLVGDAVEGTLYYIPQSEFNRLVNSPGLSLEQRITLFSDMCRLNVLYMIACAGSGHIGSSFSSLDIVSWLLLEVMDKDDVFFSSKGHDAPGYYAALIGTGKIQFDLIHKLRRLGGLPGHPDVATPHIVTNTGSLGMGVSKAKGMILANRLLQKKGRVFVMTGDGELQEGQFWESLPSAVNFGLHELVVIIDHNKLQSDTFVKNVSDLGDLESKLTTFGWCVRRCDGHNIHALSATLKSMADDPRPKIIVADTVKGKGVSFMEHTSLDSDVAMYRFHSGAPDARIYQLAVRELIQRVEERTKNAGILNFSIKSEKRLSTSSPLINAQRLIPAYSKALLKQANKNEKIVALDADLVLDTGLVPFRDTYPERFIECGIAEQDMVSVAGGLALCGMLPIVHSFSCFLSARPNEQIYNNATEKTKIIYVGSLAGVLPAGPGHSHQAVRDTAALSGIPGLIIVEPCNEDEVDACLDWAANKNKQSTYIRLSSLPHDISYRLPPNYVFQQGAGCILKDGSDVAVIGYGPLLLNSAVKASEKALSAGVSSRIINMPWLNCFDKEWLFSVVKGFKKVVLLDNHYYDGGQGQRIKEYLITRSIDTSFVSICVRTIPPSGANDEVLEHLGMSQSQIFQSIISK